MINKISTFNIVFSILFLGSFYAFCYRYLGFNFGLHFSKLNREEFKKNISYKNGIKHWLICLFVGLVISVIDFLINVFVVSPNGCLLGPYSDVFYISKIIFGILITLIFGKYSIRILNNDFKSRIFFSNKFLKTIPIIFICSFLWSSLWYVSVGGKVCYKDNTINKAKQVYVGSLINNYLNASQDFYTEFKTLAKSSKDIGRYITIEGCKTNNSEKCRNEANLIQNLSNMESTNWYSPNGNYEIKMFIKGDENIFTASRTKIPTQKGWWGISGCFNSQNSKTNSLRLNYESKNLEIASCAD